LDIDLNHGIVKGQLQFQTGENVGEVVSTIETAAAQAQSTADTANGAVAGLNTYVDGAFKDGVVDTAEAQAIDKLNKQIDTDYTSVINDYNVVYANDYLDGTAKTDLINSKNNLVSAKDALQTSINTAIADGKTTPAEKADVNTKFDTYSTNFKAYQTALSNANKAIQIKLDILSTDKVNAIEIGVANIFKSSKIEQGDLMPTVAITVDSEKIKCSEEYYTSDNQ
jgi:hypothetical protein